MMRRVSSRSFVTVVLFSLVFLCLLAVSFIAGRVSVTPKQEMSIEHRAIIDSELLLYETENAGVSLEETQRKWQVPTPLESNPYEYLPWIETVSWKPRAKIYHKFLNEWECDEIIATGGPHVERSRVVAASDKESVHSGLLISLLGRTSHGMFMGYNFMIKYPLLRSIETRCSNWTMLPVVNGENYNLLRYELSQEYRPHTDYFNPDDPIAKGYIGPGGNRIATVLIYLQDAEEGGGTIFPNADPSSLTVQPKKGDALLFWNLNPDNIPDHHSLHGGTPVVRGTKWVMTKWLHEGAIGHYSQSISKEEKEKLKLEEEQYEITRLMKIASLKNK